MRKRNCLHVDPNVFFPEHGQKYTKALECCTPCPVQEQCLLYFGHQEYGMVGALTPDQRKALRRKAS